jgi:hypothetical protein
MSYDVQQALVRIASNDEAARRVLERAGLLGQKADDRSRVDEQFRWQLLETVGEFLTAHHNEGEAHARFRKKRTRFPLRDAFLEQTDGLRIDRAHDKVELERLAGRYIELAELHAPAFTHMLAATILDTELYPLRREIEDPTSVMVSQLGKISPGIAMQLALGKYGVATSWIIILVCALASISVWNWLPWLAYVLGAYAVYAALADLRMRHKLRSAKMQVQIAMQGIANRLETVRDEIARGNFNVAAIKARLQQIEKDRGYVPSIVYTLIAVHSGGPAQTFGT